MWRPRASRPTAPTRPGTSAWEAPLFGPQTGVARGLDTATDLAAIALGLVPLRKASITLATGHPLTKPTG